MKITLIRNILPLITASTLLTACQHRTMSETTTDIVHDIMGGEISKLHPPAPGYDKDFPYLNQTPKTNPEFPSQEARNALTEKLEQERNYAQRLSLSTGAMAQINDFPPPPINTQKPQQNNPDNQQPLQDINTHNTPITAESLNDAEIQKYHIGTAPTPPQTTQQTNNHAESASLLPTPPDQPQLTYLPIDHPFPKRLPEITQPPKPPAAFPNFPIPKLHEALRPDFDITTPTGTLIKFDEESDHLSPGQEDKLAKILHDRKKRTLLLTAFGTMVNNNAGLEPEEQNHALTLALLRARTLSNYFLKHGVPTPLIIIKAQTIGEGVRVSYQ